MKSGNNVIDILMERDELTYEEAKEQVSDVADSIKELLADGGSYEEVEDIMLYELGLEMDYVFDMLFS